MWATLVMLLNIDAISGCSLEPLGNRCSVFVLTLRNFPVAPVWTANFSTVLMISLSNTAAFQNNPKHHPALKMSAYICNPVFSLFRLIYNLRENE